jgi:hypothetical protein
MALFEHYRATYVRNGQKLAIRLKRQNEARTVTRLLIGQGGASRIEELTTRRGSSPACATIASRPSTSISNLGNGEPLNRVTRARAVQVVSRTVLLTPQDKGLARRR